VEQNTDVSTSSTGFTLMPGMTITMTTAGGNVEALFTSSVKHSRGSKYSDYALFVDGVEKFRVRQETTEQQEATGISLAYLVSNLSAGQHTFEIRWRCQSANTAYQWGGTWGAGRHLYVVEHP
jgi:hypothetical protein